MNDKKRVRAAFRSAVHKRDSNRCRACGAKPPPGVGVEDFLDAHHVTNRNDMPAGGYVAENGISLCAECHIKAEEFHQTMNIHWFEGFLPEDLYALIGSTKEKAIEASLRLERKSRKP